MSSNITNKSSRASSASSGSQSGAVAVEFALVLPLLGMLLLGIITFGLAYNNHLGLTNTVREGARFGASTDNTNLWGAAVLERTKNLYFNADSPLVDSEVCALLISRAAGSDTIEQSSHADCEIGSTDAGGAPDTPDDIPDGSCLVKVWAQKPANLNWLLFSREITLRAESVSFYDRNLACP